MTPLALWLVGMDIENSRLVREEVDDE